MKKALTVLILFLIGFLFAVYFLFPKYSEYKTLKQTISKRELLLQQKKEYFANLERSFNVLRKYTEAIDKIKSALPEEISYADLLNFFQEKALENGLMLESLSQIKTEENRSKQEKEKAQERIKETIFALRLLGNLRALEGFLKSVEQSARLFEVEKINLTSAKEGILKIILSIKVYSY